MEWYVLTEDLNRKEFRAYDIMKHGRFNEESIKKLKKKCLNKEEFIKEIKSDLIYYYWGKCEWEVLINKNKEGNVIVDFWIGKRDDDGITLADNIPHLDNFDWSGFYDYINKKKCSRDGWIKIDVYDQVEYQLDKFVDYCWKYKHKYQRHTVNQ